MRQYFIKGASERGYEVIDMQPIFQARHDADGSRFEFATDAHWNADGYQAATEAVVSSKLFSCIEHRFAIHLGNTRET